MPRRPLLACTDGTLSATLQRLGDHFDAGQAVGTELVASNRRADAVKPWRWWAGPTGPISPAQNMPATAVVPRPSVKC
jgi:hypothetical protein